MSDGILGHGASLKICANSSFTTVTTIGNITNISGANQTRDSIDKSTMDSTNKCREFIPGMLDAGEITADLNYDGAAAGEANLLNTAKTNAAQYWRITFNDHTTASSRSYWQSAGFITALGHAIPYEDKVTQSVTIKCTGAPTFVTHAA